MAKRVRRVIRRVKQPLTASFDDQLWPVNIVLLILGGFLTGEILIFGDFTTPAVFSNGWTWLSWVWFAVIGTMLLAWKAGGRTARRTQLSGAVALVLTLSLLTACYYFHIFSAVAIEDTLNDVAATSDFVAPEVVQYLEIQQPHVVLEHERPVETEPLEPETSEPEQQTTQSDPAVRSPVPNAQPTPQVERQADASARQQPERRRTPPKQAETTGRLSRQPQPSTARPNQVASPTVSTQEQPKAATLDAQTQPVAPRKSMSASQRATAATDPATEVTQPTLQTARQPTALSDKPKLDTSRPSQQRAVRQPAEVPNTLHIAKVPPTASDASEPSQLQPSHSIKRQTATSEIVPQQQPSNDVIASEPRRDEPARESPAPREPQLTRSDVTAPSRSAEVANSAIDKRATPDQQVAKSQQTPTTPLQPKSSTIQRQTSTATGAKPDVTASKLDERPVTTSAESMAQSRQATATTAPTLQPNEQASDHPRRASRIAESEASPVALSNPAVVQSSQPTQHSVQPRASAHSVSRRGVAGAGAQRNLDDGDPAPRTVAPVASAAARRSTATSENPNPNDLLTSQQASVAKDRALASAPSSTLQAQPIDAAAASGATDPSELDASSSAAMRVNSAAQNQATVTADVGNTEFDTGPTQIASELESGRAAGGGEPEVHHATPSAEAQRLAPAGGELLAALDTHAIAAQPVDIEADGGGQPPAPAADAAATAATRTSPAASAQAAAMANDQPGDAAPSGSHAEQLAAIRRMREKTAAATPPGATPGGGTDKPVREGRIQHTATAKADAPTIESPAGGQAAPEGPQAAGGQLSRVGGSPGQRQPAVTKLAGAAESDAALNVPDLGAKGTRGGERSEAPDGDQVANATSTGGAPLKQSTAASLPGVANVQVDDELAGGAPQSEAPLTNVSPGVGQGTPQRRESGGTQVLAPAEPGDGGIGSESSQEVGNPSRKAQRTSDVVTLDADARFQRRDVGGPIQPGNTRARDARPAFERRKNSKPVPSKPGAKSRHLEVAIQSGLEFLRLQQSDNGGWSFHNFPAAQDGSLQDEIAQVHADTAATGLTLMSFLGAGYDHFDYGGEYTQEVQAGLDYLVKNQKDNGDLYVPQDAISNRSAALYSHAIATMALCEAYGMTHDPKLKLPAQKALQYVVDTQHEDRGGWRYLAKSSSDLSVTGWMFVALKSGKLAGLEVPEESLNAALGYLDRCQGNTNGENGYVYNPDALDTPTQRLGRDVTRPMSAVGLLMRLYQGRDRSDAEIRAGADFLMQQPPAYYAGQRDTYYWYYATQVMFHMKGDYWEKWQLQLHELLRDTQEKQGPLAGSWNPRGPVPDRWGAQGGRIYVTTMNLLSLEVSYRYLPLYVEVE